MYEFRYHYVKSKYGENAKLCYMDTGIFIAHVKTWYLQRHCRKCWNRIWHLKFEFDRPLPKGKIEKVIEVMKDELGGQIVKEFVGLRANKN